MTGIETALIGAAATSGGVAIGATGALAFTAGTAATTGLIGAGGAFGLGGSLFSFGNLLSFGSSLLGGFADSGDAEFQAELLRRQADNEEADRLIERDRRQRAARRFAATQEVRNAFSGFSIEGTPTEVIAESAGEFGEDQFIADLNTKAKVDELSASAQNLLVSASNRNVSRVFDLGKRIIKRG